MSTWSATALNTAPDSENRIHGDEIAKEHGFEGGLVPGVTISAYLVKEGGELKLKFLQSDLVSRETKPN